MSDLANLLELDGVQTTYGFSRVLHGISLAIAPGEKVDAPIPNGEMRTKDGTSMAAPHVSGAAAMLMARHSELIGQPDRIKAALCDTATDLGRERYFQGAGMLDVLRAIQESEGGPA